MGRRGARELALQILYRMDVLGDWSAEDMRIPGENGPALTPDSRDLLRAIAAGVIARREAIDRLIVKYSENWKIDRMPIVDRNLLRMAIFELVACPDIPAKVAITEALELGKQYSSLESVAFINAILDRVAKEELHRDPAGEP